MIADKFLEVTDDISIFSVVNDDIILRKSLKFMKLTLLQLFFVIYLHKLFILHFLVVAIIIALIMNVSCSSLLLKLFLDSLLLQNGIHLLLSLVKFLSNLLVSAHPTLYPRMLRNLNYRRPLARFKGKHLLN
jgi:hypothetical protein